MVKGKKIDTLQHLLESFTNELKQFKTHAYNIRHQYTQYQRRAVLKISMMNQ